MSSGYRVEGKGVFMAVNGEAECWMTKGTKRHVQSSLKTVAETMNMEAAKWCECRQKRYSDIERPLKAVNNVREPGVWRVLEVFTWSYMLTITAGKCGWDAY